MLNTIPEVTCSHISVFSLDLLSYLSESYDAFQNLFEVPPASFAKSSGSSVVQAAGMEFHHVMILLFIRAELIKVRVVLQ